MRLVHKNFPEADMGIVAPCEMFMEGFLRLFREKYGDTENYYRSMRWSGKEIQMLMSKLVWAGKENAM